jgi:hypothetical protein
MLQNKNTYQFQSVEVLEVIVIVTVVFNVVLYVRFILRNKCNHIMISCVSNLDNTAWYCIDQVIISSKIISKMIKIY